MKTFILILLLSMSFGWSDAQSLVSFGQPDSIYSGILKEKRPLWIYSPKVDTTWFVKPSYPVLYVLDGDFHFAALQTMIQQLGVINGNNALPQMIIVGVPNTNGNRTRDLTPFGDAREAGSGGGEAFTAFLEKELVPYISHHYPVAPYRIIVGHSLGGLLVTNALLKHTTAFDAYVAIEPSLFWNNSYLLTEADSLLQPATFQHRKFFLALSHTMNPGLDTQQVKTDRDRGSIHTSAILQLSDKLKSHPGNGLKWTYKYYEEDDHNSIPLIAEYDALRFIFKENRFPSYLFFNKDGSPDSLKNLIVQHYKLLSKERGYDVRPSEQLFNEFAYRHLQQKNYDKALLFFQLNIDYFPESFNTYDGMGDYYQALHDTAHAIAYWKKALSMRYLPEIREKIEKAEIKPSAGGY